jgi:phospholipid/cholesterol/gamma-HCH transport system substrate-binding protein
VGRTGLLVTRLLTAGAVLLAVVVIALLLFGGGSGYRVSMLLETSSQLVTGNEVKVGGVPIGVVSSIELTEDYQARVEVEIANEVYTPLRKGTRAEVLFDSLSSVAARYLSLTMGPEGAEEIEDGGVLPPDQTKAAVDPDQVLNTIDRRVQRDLRGLLRKAPKIFEGRAAGQANAGFEALSPALSQSSALAQEIAKDERALRRLLTKSADVVSALASRPEDLEQLTANALATTQAIADHDRALDSALVQLPPTLRRTNTTLVNLRSTLEDLRPLVRETRPAARPLTEALQRVRPIVGRARPVVAKLRETVRRPGARNDLLDALRGILPVAREGVPAFNSTAQLLKDLATIVTELRPYTPDLVNTLGAFSGTSSGYYDANGHYLRISFQGSLFTLSDTGALVPLPELSSLTGLRRGIRRRCPGAATQPLPDGSNPYVEDEAVCNRGDTLK